MGWTKTEGNRVGEKQGTVSNLKEEPFIKRRSQPGQSAGYKKS